MNKKENKKKQESILPSISLPKGGGAISTIGEKFSVNTITGTGTASIPLPVSPGRNGFHPQLALTYDSGSGNSPFGLGWSLSISSITRKTAKGLPQYRDQEKSDVFLLSGAEDLVPFLDEESNWEQKEKPQGAYTIYYYHPRTEGLFARIEKWVHDTSKDTYWRTISKENITSIYGKSLEARIVHPDNENQVFQWLLEESRDNRGNIIQYAYEQENHLGVDTSLPSEHHRVKANKCFNQRYLKTIAYGNRKPDIAADWHFQLVFDYGEHDPHNPTPDDHLNPNHQWKLRQDPFSNFRSGFEIRTYRYCERILLFHQFDQLNNGTPTLVRSTQLEFNDSYVATTLAKAWQTGYIKTENGYTAQSTPPVEFSYSEPHIGTTIKTLPPESLENLPVGLDGVQYQFVDLEGEGIAGILTQQGGGWHYKENQGNGHFSTLKTLHSQPSLSGAGQPQLQDINGDGNKELMILAPQHSGFYSYKASKWENFTPFKAMPNINWQDPNVKLIDLTGDGFADILITEDEVLRWFPSKAKAGYDPDNTVRKKTDEQQGPALVFDDGTASVYLADMSGDGLTDIVRIRNKDIVYWPNLGYGRFGTKIIMNNAPQFDSPEEFEARNIRLADIDGSGTTDILYLGNSAVRFWINQSGNDWSDPQTLAQVPDTDTLTHVQLADLLGKGTPCLVWSSPLPGNTGRQMQYIDLMEPTAVTGTAKPYLLYNINNNMGKKDRIHYAPSTKFYLEDKQAGTPWITKLHFPVHVVEKTESIDHISNARLITTYTYHHGYYDPVEREFRGFGRVEQRDAESFEEFTQHHNGESLDHFVPPVFTKSWFHTGAYVEEGIISRQYASEYFKETDIEGALHSQENYLLDDSVIENEAELDFNAKREAYRALRGQLLRQEVYALDGSEKEPIPYTATETNYSIRQLQPHKGQQHAVYLLHPNESISFHYERQADDPRVSHSLTLEVDNYGTPLKSAEVVYPRRINGRELPPEQSQLHIVLSETQVVHKDNEEVFYLLGVPVEEKSFEVTGVTPDALYFTAGELERKLKKEALEEASELKPEDIETLKFHEQADVNKAQKRLLSWGKSFYWKNDLSDALAHGEVAWPLLPHHSEAAVFTPELLQTTFGDKLSVTDIKEKGKYILHDGYWWNPGSIQHFQYHDTPAENYTRNRENPFLLPVATQNPFEEDLTKLPRVFYDGYSLAAVSSEDQEGNSTYAEIDYRTLAPVRITDSNENSAEAITDELGMVIATTAYGTQLDENGTIVTAGDLPIADYQRVSPENPEAVINDPHQFLQHAGAFFYYDLHAWINRNEPPQFIGLARETHARELQEGEETIIHIALGYSDGFGRELQQKVKTDPGKAYISDGKGSLVLDAEGNPVQEEVETRWLSSGRTVVNNKQKPVKAYEPFYIDSHTYIPEEEVPKIGISPVLHYDPLLRVVRTDTPKGFFSKVEFSPWASKTYDLNDTVLDSEYYKNVIVEGSITVSEQEIQALNKATAHYDTPPTAIFDTLSRPFKTIETDEHGEEYITHTTFNITGQPLTIADPRQFDANTAPERENKPVYNYQHLYNMAGEPLYSHSIDAGESWSFENVLGNPVFSWTARGFKNSVVYDPMQRPLEVWCEDGHFEMPVMMEKTVYGKPADPPEWNSRGQQIAAYDQTGKSTVDRISFKGEALQSSRQFVSVFKENQPGILKESVGDTLNWEIVNDNDLETEVFTEKARFDALGRAIATVAPDGSITRPVFNHAGQLKKVKVDLGGKDNVEDYVTDIVYNEKGQRTAIVYGNGVKTTYAYEDLTYRLINLKTTRNNDDDVLQNLFYHYDPSGNITEIRDEAQQTLFYNGEVVNAHNDYTYDAFYQLIKATGREHIGQHQAYNAFDKERTGRIHKSDGSAMRNYEQQFAYDKAGNKQWIQHRVKSNPASGYADNWTRQFTYAGDSNRLLLSGTENTMNSSGSTQQYTYDDAGNIQHLATADALHWNYKNELSQLQRGTTQAWYQYSGGERARKLIKKGNILEVRYYLGGFEIFRKYKNGKLELERETLHIMDDTRRIALIDTRTASNPPLRGGRGVSENMTTRYQLDNHLGSASLEVDEKAKVISYEEYYAYGCTSYQAVDSSREAPVKRYRYTGMERDEESGLNYHSARYYAPWLGRWLKPDPAGTVDGLNVFTYVNNNPLIFNDPSGSFKAKVDKNRDIYLVGEKGDDFGSLLNYFEKHKIKLKSYEMAEIQAQIYSYINKNKHLGGFKLRSKLLNNIVGNTIARKIKSIIPSIGQCWGVSGACSPTMLNRVKYGIKEVLGENSEQYRKVDAERKFKYIKVEGSKKKKRIATEGSPEGTIGAHLFNANFTQIKISGSKKTLFDKYWQHRGRKFFRPDLNRKDAKNKLKALGKEVFVGAAKDANFPGEEISKKDAWKGSLLPGAMLGMTKHTGIFIRYVRDRKNKILAIEFRDQNGNNVQFLFQDGTIRSKRIDGNAWERKYPLTRAWNFGKRLNKN